MIAIAFEWVSDCNVLHCRYQLPPVAVSMESAIKIPNAQTKSHIAHLEALSLCI